MKIIRRWESVFQVIIQSTHVELVSLEIRRKSNRIHIDVHLSSVTHSLTRSREREREKQIFSTKFDSYEMNKVTRDLVFDHRPTERWNSLLFLSLIDQRELLEAFVDLITRRRIRTDGRSFHRRSFLIWWIWLESMSTRCHWKVIRTIFIFIFFSFRCHCWHIYSRYSWRKCLCTRWKFSYWRSDYWS